MAEPFGALDPLTRDALGDDYRALHDKLGLTTVMITHDMTEAILLADRVAVMRAGRLLAQGTPAELAHSGDASVGELLPTPPPQPQHPQILQPPVLRNPSNGLGGVHAAILEAAQGVGMTPRQSLFMVELPLALPVIMAGIRTAAVWVIGTATLSTPIGQTSLGNYIFAGLQTQNWVFVLFGCLAAAVLALAVDQLLALIETGIRNRSRVRAVLGRIGIAALVAATLVPSMTRPPSTYLVGAKTFAERYVLAALIAH